MRSPISTILVSVVVFAGPRKRPLSARGWYQCLFRRGLYERGDYFE